MSERKRRKMPMPALEDPIKFAEYLVAYLGMVAAFRIARTGTVFGQFLGTGREFNFGEGRGTGIGFMERPAILAVTGLAFFQFFNALDPDGDPYWYEGGFNPWHHIRGDRYEVWWRQVALAVFAIYIARGGLRGALDYNDLTRGAYNT